LVPEHHVAPTSPGEIRSDCTDLDRCPDSGPDPSHNASTGPDRTERRRRGAFFTAANPFVFPAFADWAAGVPGDVVVLEPFAGAGDLVRLAGNAGFVRTWAMFDIEPAAAGIVKQDTLADFPVGFSACVTNPPYLSAHVARRRGLDVDHTSFGGHRGLYQYALERCLANCGHVAAIVPESLVTSGLFRDRLSSVVSLPGTMFADTTMPVCLALFGPHPVDDTAVWVGDLHVGTLSELTRPLQLPACAGRVRFNVVAGQIGLRATDTSTGPTIAFCAAGQIPAERVNHASRLITRIAVADLEVRPEVLIDAANDELARWRHVTADAALTAFCGTRNDGRHRRRLDYRNARALLSLALCHVEGHHAESCSDRYRAVAVDSSAGDGLLAA
jgi:hypothetical protein